MAETRLPPWTASQERWADVFINWMTAANVWIYKATGGRLGAKFMRGAPVCLVTTVGKKSGLPRTVALIYLQDGPNVVLVASKGGMSHSPDWYWNMKARPEITVQIGNVTTPMRVRQATPDEKRALWPRLCATYPDYDDYQARTTRDIPVMIASPAI